MDTPAFLAIRQAAGFFIAKADVMWLYNSYDNEDNLATVFLDCTLYIPT